MAAVREAIGRDTLFMIDNNAAYGLNDCVRFSRGIEQYDITWLEEPLHWYLQPRDYVQLAAETQHPALARRARDPSLHDARLHRMRRDQVSAVRFDARGRLHRSDARRAARRAARRLRRAAPFARDPRPPRRGDARSRLLRGIARLGHARPAAAPRLRRAHGRCATATSTSATSRASASRSTGKRSSAIRDLIRTRAADACGAVVCTLEVRTPIEEQYMKVWLSLLAAVLATHAAHASAQTYPTRPVRIIVPFAPGGGNDIVARFVAQRMTESFGQTAVVDNRAGAGSTLGTDVVAKSAPDGYTLLVTHNAIAINETLYPKLPYDAEKDFAQVILVGSTTNTLVVNPKVAGEKHEGADRAREGQAGRAQLRQHRRRRHVAPRHGIFQALDRHRPRAHSLQRHRSGADGRHRRTGSGDDFGAARARSRSSRASASSRSPRRARSARLPARPADPRRVRRAGLCLRHLVRHTRAGESAEGDRHQAEQHDREVARHAGGEGSALQGRNRSRRRARPKRSGSSWSPRSRRWRKSSKPPARSRRCSAPRFARSRRRAGRFSPVAAEP